MPIFEYHCAACGKNFEELVTSSSQKICCPSCGGEETEKLMSCCRHKTAGVMPPIGQGPRPKSSCSGCSGGNCSSCH